MLTVVYCARESKPKHKEHIIKSSGLDKHIEVIEIINNNNESLTKCFNRTLKIANNNIVVFCHDDIIIETKQWGKKLIKQFKENNNYGIIGVVGTKFMPKSGRWWDNRKALYGRVMHTQRGESFLSTYSDDQGNKLEEVIIVDGVFFAVNRDILKASFDESVEGFHFYDVDFSFRNHVAGAKIGVTTRIRINHLSNGETNEQWEENRKQFVKNFSADLPKIIPEPFDSTRKLKVMFPHVNKNHSLDTVTKLGSELTKLNCVVAVVSNFDQKNLTVCKNNNLKPYTLQEPPDFRFGDGKFMIPTPDGPVLSDLSKLYKVIECEYDIIVIDNPDLLNTYKAMYPECRFVDATSEQFIEMDKTPGNYKNLLVETFNQLTID